MMTTLMLVIYVSDDNLDYDGDDDGSDLINGELSIMVMTMLVVVVVAVMMMCMTMMKILMLTFVMVVINCDYEDDESWLW